MNQQKIQMVGVKSSQIESIGHHGNTLAVKFRNGSTYHYHGVTGDQFDALKMADSVGSHLNAHIKPKFKCTKLQ